MVIYFELLFKSTQKNLLEELHAKHTKHAKGAKKKKKVIIGGR